MRAYEFSLNELAADKNTIEPVKTLTDQPINTIEFRNVKFQYTTQPVLNNLCVEIQKGDFVGITGDSGTGKTTILNLLLGFLTPASGEILVNGVATSANDRKNYWLSIAYVRQQSFFIYDTILRNITLEEDGYNRNNLETALEVSGLTELVSTFPEGLNKIITENGKNISGGQQQRIAIARAVYKNSDLVLLDEPFNELDEESTIKLVNHFKQMSSDGKTIIMITHDKKSLSHCNKIISPDEQ